MAGEAPAATSRALPPTARGQRTRESLIAAARSVFEQHGYLDARLSDISKEAGVSVGSFYVYFASKEEIFAAVLEQVQDEMLHPRVSGAGHGSRPIADIEASNRAYLSWYQRNALFMRALEQAATSDDNLRELRRRRGEAFARRNARSIRELQAKGLADPSLDALLAAKAVDSMVGRMAYATYVLGDECPFEDLVAVLTRLWVNALRIQPDES
ncbi:MAG TPA: TetR/AcrR family transcriptional regulator [Pseudonocardiaceae bacterium]|nr:TetR/AcrR family transcriptional regulator [Pseudonocardiaceae bacterium]